MISPTELRAAADAIQAGKLVAFPTETVYGLGANALDPAAVMRIFEAKGRPSTSPLIVHVASIEQARELAAEWPPEAQALAARFWPGPLTLVLRKNPIIPDIVTAGLDSVGLRMPANEVALALLREAGVPIAAPSANRFTELSPTLAMHVARSLGDRIEVLLDGGPTGVGIESAVVALTARGAELLRPGVITREEIEAVVGLLRDAGDSPEAAHRSPGQHARHYRPRTRLVLSDAANLPRDGKGVLLAISPAAVTQTIVAMPGDPRAYAGCLYAVLHDLDSRGLDWIAVAPVPKHSDWDGVRDRLERASSE